MKKGDKVLVGVLAVVLLVVATGGSLYLYLSGRSYVFAFSEEQLREKLAERLPLTKTYFSLIQLTLDHPRVALTEGTNRVQAGLEVTLNLRVGDEPKQLGGSVDVSGGVKYVPESGEFFLTDPVVERFSVQGVPEKYAPKINDALTKLLGDYYAAHPIYTLKATDVKHAVAKLLLRDVTVRDKTLLVTLGL